jgi:benzoate transport
MANTTTDPTALVADSPMSGAQILIVAITILLNALDGFDVLAISFASPGIAAEWGINRAALGIVLSMELIGMAFGSVFIGRVADDYGRRRTMLGCLVAMAAGMLLAPTADGVVQLSIWRVITGLGIGGMLAAINATASEFSNLHRRHLSVSLMAIGYPIGAVIGGTVSAQLLKSFDWRSVFYLGGILTAICMPLVYFFVPETIQWLQRKRPENALERINATLRRLGKGTVDSLPEETDEERQQSSSGIFSTALLAITVIVTLTYSLHVTTFYFVLKWVPKIVVDMGFPASTAAGVLVWVSVGGAIGGAVFGLLTLRINVKGLTIATLLLSTIMVILFGRSPADLGKLSLYCGLAGFFTNAGIVGMYAIFAQAYPTRVRASGTGFAVGFGRGGAVLSPIIAGFLFEGGFGVPGVATFMAFGSLAGAVALFFLRLAPEAKPAATVGH